jgi:hypothetical protein
VVLVDLVDRLLAGGVVLAGELTLSLATWISSTSS